MRIFILDDDKSVIRILKKIIEDKELGQVVGTARDGKEGLEKIRTTTPDIVLIDLLMPKVDGLTVIKKLKKEHPGIEFIMISQVSSKDMVEQAYKLGVEYYIYKPINAIEVEAIMKKVIERIEINRSISKIQQIFSDKPQKEWENLKHYEQCINGILMKLGIMGEKGAEDIIKVSKYIIQNNINLNQITIRELCSKFTDNPKAMEQRIRRTIGIAMSNIASLGIEDYMNETFVEYSNSLFNFEQVRKEMEFIRGKSNKRGSTNTKKFLLGLISYCENMNN
ncbi:two-component system response regulator YcbB [Keratinibaculum paraultunense]|uniref:Two-component system response regulator YcbB n=1 Tax=Keratinibaculum paraultunense TaxID=1278232 RepID=A0A4R3KRH3_9FIRM|nr:response regulator [Keratinibaculum paraultunense]QQY79569.1 response regulator [Keratinibaculum paraultunense]TCS87594.1 two-component system response regulator YcbB [Keratinibaculum paraultunense]